MKISKVFLKQIIKEELAKVVKEYGDVPDWEQPDYSDQSHQYRAYDSKANCPSDSTGKCLNCDGKGQIWASSGGYASDWARCTCCNGSGRLLE